MLAVKPKIYTILDWTLTLTNAILAANYFLLARHSLSSSPTSAEILVIGIGIVQLIYRLTLYFALQKRSLVAASLINTSLVTINVIVVLLASGGLASPYYPLWLIFILLIGIYRPSIPMAFLLLTTLYFVGSATTSGYPSQLAPTALSALIASYMMGALGFWLWHSKHTKSSKQSPAHELSQKLSQEQLKSEILLHYIGEGVMVVDLQSRVKLINPAAQQLTGWPESDAKGIDNRIVMPLADESGHSLIGGDDPFSEVIASRQTLARDDIIISTRSKRKIPLSLLISPIFDDSGNLTGTIAVFRDITQSKASERQRSEFISTASHEMRTPVAATEGYISLALNPKVTRIDDKARDYLAKAQTSIQHLGKLFQDLLAITRIEEGKLPSHPEATEAVSLANQVIDELRFKAKAKNLGLNLKANGQVGSIKTLHPLYYIYADQERIREVLINLIDNAIKFTNQGDVSITLDGDSEKVTFGVEDSGIGIAPEDIPHLFQKFYRIDNRQTRNIGGTGLGLYICRAIIEMYQGRIWVESRTGVGSAFKFSLPRLDYAKAQALLAKPAPVATVAAPIPATKPQPLIASQLSHKVE